MSDERKENKDKFGNVQRPQDKQEKRESGRSQDEQRKEGGNPSRRDPSDPNRRP